MRIILASRSPARRALMKELDIPFECHTSDYEEDMRAFKTPKALAQFLALGKATFIAHQYPDSIIIGADTFVTINDQKIGKPENIEDAKKILKKKSNSKVLVHSGVAVIQTDKKGEITKKVTEHVITTLHFGKITDEDIQEILKEDDVLSVAGALTIEGAAGKFVKTIEGDYHNVIGLPLFQLKEMLKKFGLKLN